MQLVGGCPVVMSFASNKFSREIRLEAALFIGSMCRTSLLTVRRASREPRAAADVFSVDSAADVRQLPRLEDAGRDDGREL